MATSTPIMMLKITSHIVRMHTKQKQPFVDFH